MQKTLETLIHLQRTEIDRLRRQYNVLLDRQDGEFVALDGIANQLGTEQSYCRKFDGKAVQTSENLPDFGSYSRRMMVQKAHHEETLRLLEPEIEALQIALTDAFAERKRYEIITERHEQAVRDERQQAEQQFLDENTILRYQK
ncbi:MAG: flagellar FliJ family protein [Alphaproteobacteria bacterium]|nr:flagellar FliJ family protein [Alphaproteobacteria bacterium]